MDPFPGMERLTVAYAPTITHTHTEKPESCKREQTGREKAQTSALPVPSFFEDKRE